MPRLEVRLSQQTTVVFDVETISAVACTTRSGKKSVIDCRRADCPEAGS